jgi:zinc transporter, ZIP family
MAPAMITAFLWGAAGASPLLVGAVIAYLSRPGRVLIAVVMAVGTGVLLGSVSYELVDDAIASSDVVWVAALVLVGAGAFTFGDWLLARKGGSERKDPTGAQADASPLGIVLGSVLDGIPESFVLGLTAIGGGISASLFVGIVLSNLPEGMASSSGLRIAGWPRRRVFLMWGGVILVSAVSAALGSVLLGPDTGRAGAAAQGVRRRRAARDARRHVAARGLRGRGRLHGNPGRGRLRGVAGVAGPVSARVTAGS